MSSTVYYALGGLEAVRSAVGLFYGRILADVRVNHFFKGVDMGLMQKKQVQFMQYAFGGPEQYHGKDLYNAHLKLMQEKGLNELHFDIIVEHFVAVLIELKVPEELIPECLAILGPAREYFRLREEDKANPEVVGGDNNCKCS